MFVNVVFELEMIFLIGLDMRLIGICFFVFLIVKEVFVCKSILVIVRCLK